MLSSRPVVIGLAALLWLGLGPAAGQAATGDGPLLQLLIESADTPQEHAALAAYYRREAARVRDMAEMHRAMAQRYAGGKISQRQQMRKHCDGLVSSYEQLAVEYDGLAKTHEEAAKP